jgi:hypothetical protein
VAKHKEEEEELTKQVELVAVVVVLPLEDPQ